uniref:Uncharacterized protein n=1 Tax=Cupriavidus metallidurans (strain ATCC 43123 / DSM 2839 / NBRC 102507 / CH34) TaxID=266264 RepID=A0AAI8Y660_CUPMC|nr:hypothetical protein [Cupriavidus metallidurans CH34]
MLTRGMLEDQKTLQFRGIHAKLQGRRTFGLEVIDISENDSIDVSAGVNQHLPERSLTVRGMEDFHNLNHVEKALRFDQVTVDRQLC